MNLKLFNADFVAQSASELEKVDGNTFVVHYTPTTSLKYERILSNWHVKLRVTGRSDGNETVLILKQASNEIIQFWDRLLERWGHQRETEDQLLRQEFSGLLETEVRP